MTEYVCLVFGKNDEVRDVQTIARDSLTEAILTAVSITTAVPDARGYQLWSGGKTVCAQLGRQGVPWHEVQAQISVQLPA